MPTRMSPRSVNQQGGAGASMFVGILIVIVVLVALYYLYKWLYSSTVPTSVSILSGTPDMTTVKADPGSNIHTASSSSAVSIVDLQGVNDSGEYSVTFWTYIANTSGFLSAGNATKLAHLMEISNDRFKTGNTATKGNTLLFVGLNPANATLVVRQSTSDSEYQINNQLDAPSESGNAYPLNSIINGYNSSSTIYNGGVVGGSNRCDIVNGIEYQRWVLISVVSNAKVLDVYIDGKLARSCAYSAPNALQSPNGTATAYFGLNNENNLKGYFSNGKFYNYALTPANVWSIYQNGPGEEFNLSKWFLSFFSAA